jgi:hypothetical protein
VASESVNEKDIKDKLFYIKKQTEKYEPISYSTKGYTQQDLEYILETNQNIKNSNTHEKKPINDDNEIIKFFSIFLILTLAIIYIWFRFIRERLPKEIPFYLSITTWCFLIIICLVLGYSIIKLLFRIRIVPTLNIRYHITERFKEFVRFLVDNHHTKPYFEKNIIRCLELIEKRYKYVHVFFLLIPLTILVTTFLLDVFYFYRLYYFYKLIWLGLLPLSLEILLYIFKGLCVQTTETIDKKAEFYCVSLPPVETVTLAPGVVSNVIPMLPAHELVLLRAARISNKGTLIEYFPSFRLDWLARERIRLNLPDSFRLDQKKFNFEMRGAINLATSTVIMINLYEKEKNKYRYIRVIISSGYLIGWLYILFTGIMLPDVITLLETLRDMEETFRETWL